MRIVDKVAVVTGGASGLGESVVRLFTSLGCKVAIWDMNSSLGEKLSSEFGSQVLFVKVDVTSEDSVKTALSATFKAFGKVNILVNSAGVVYGHLTITPKAIHPLADFERVIRINLTGTFNVSRLIAKEMSTLPEIDGERGVIVNVASIAAYEGQRGQDAYGSSKGGVVGLTLPMARDLASYGIRVNSLAPGPFMTKMGESIPEKYVKALVAQSLVKRVGDPKEFAHAVRFLVENTYMNGAIIRIDGGMRMPHV